MGTSRRVLTLKDLQMQHMNLSHHTVPDSLKSGLPSDLELKLHSIASVLQSGHSETKASPQLAYDKKCILLIQGARKINHVNIKRCLAFDLDLLFVLYSTMHTTALHILSTVFGRSKNCLWRFQTYVSPTDSNEKQCQKHFSHDIVINTACENVLSLCMSCMQEQFDLT